MKLISGNFSYHLLVLLICVTGLGSFLAVGCGSSGSGESDYSSPPTLSSSITGQVIDSSTGAAIPDAVLVLENGFRDYVAMTDGRGTYSIDNVEVGSYRLTAGKSGFVTANQSVLIQAGINHVSSIVLDPYVSTGSLTGTVVQYVSDSSIPVPLENVYVEFPNIPISCYTDSSGMFTVSDLPSGMNICILTLDGFREHRAFVDITADSTVFRTFEMLNVSGNIEGCVRGLPSMNPLTGILVSIDPLELSTITGADGCYFLSGVTSGIWPVTFLADSYTETEIVTNIVDGRTTELDVDMSYGFGTVEGVVTNSMTGDPVSGVTISLPVSGLTSTTNFFGEYRLYQNVRTGSFVPVGSEHPSYLSSGTYVSVDPMEVVTVDFSIIPRYGTLQGIVRTLGTSTPVAGASLTIVPLGASTSSDGAGNYSFSNVLPGFTPVTVSASGYQTITTSVATFAGTTVYADIYVPLSD